MLAPRSQGEVGSFALGGHVPEAPMSNPADPLTLAQDYIRFMEAQAGDGIARVLASNARQVFVLGKDPVHPTAVFDGKAQVMAYADGLFQKFERLAWVGKGWTVSADGGRRRSGRRPGRAPAPASSLRTLATP